MSAPETIGHPSHASENPRRSRLLWSHLGKVRSFRMNQKLVLHKLRFHPDFVALFSPPCEGGVRGGGPGTTSHKVFPCSVPLSPFASLSRGEKNRFRFPRLPHHPPCPPFASFEVA